MAATPKVYVAGEEGSPLRSRTGKPVRIEEIRDQYNRNNLFQDVDFPAAPSSIGNLSGDAARDTAIPKNQQLTWMRPHEICRGALVRAAKPEFATAQDSFSKSRCSEYDIEQGSNLGDCWYVAAVQALAKKPEKLAFVIPEDNYDGFDDDQYCGAFHFRFYTMADAKWVDVVVDDLLPVNYMGLPVFAKLTTSNNPGRAEFWVALMEKAYAKLHGSFLGIEGGLAPQALENFCEGFAESIDLKEPDVHNLENDKAAGCKLNDIDTAVKKFLLGYIRGDSFMSLSSYPKKAADYPQAARGYTEWGLVGPHAYTVLDAQEVNFKPPRQGSRVLVKIRNPHASNEWKGAFSDNDNFNWGMMERDLRERDQFGNTNIDEGNFWMDLSDVILYFRLLGVCHFGMTDGTKLATRKGVWPAALQTTPPPTTYVAYSQYGAYKFEVKMGEHATKYAAQSGGKAIVCYSVVLEGYSSSLSPRPLFYACLFKMNSPDEPLRDVLIRGELRSTQSQCREASGWAFVDPGYYIIVPQLYTKPIGRNRVAFPPEMAGQPITFAIRVFTENETTIEQVVDTPKFEDQRPIPPSDMQQLLSRFQETGLAELFKQGGLDPNLLNNLNVQVQVRYV